MGICYLRSRMKLKLVVIGKTAQSYLKEGIEEYGKRIKRYRPFEMIVLPDPKNASKLPQEKLKQAEGELLLRQFDATDHVVLLDERGRSFRSIEFAKHLETLQNRGARTMVLVVGGAYGFSDAVYARANEQISLSKMTFSHQMIRLFAIEQLYRALTIQKGEPYHHE